LFQVSCGVDSLVLGESQILGQVKSAFEYSRSQGALGGTLDELFRRALPAASARAAKPKLVVARSVLARQQWS
jgi:glutamyl-tRNA reductase